MRPLRGLRALPATRLRPIFLAALLAMGLLLAGCIRTVDPVPSGAPSPSPTKSPGPAHPCSGVAIDATARGFSGESAYARLCALLFNATGAPLARVPGTRSHDALAKALEAQMRSNANWTVQPAVFYGSGYYANAHQGVQGFLQACTAAERQRVENTTFTNLWSYHLPREPSNLSMVLVAHWDAKRHADMDPDAAKRTFPVHGANDGGAGVAILLQLMADVSAGRLVLPYNLWVLLVDGEDGFEDCHPLAGSVTFAHFADFDTKVRVLVLDMVGDPNARFVRETQGARCDPAFYDLLWEAAPSHGLAENMVPGIRDIFDDHYPFLWEGYPAIDLIDAGRPGGTGFPPYWHTTGDTIDKVSPEMMGKVGRLVSDVLARPQLTANWPGPCNLYKDPNADDVPFPM